MRLAYVVTEAPGEAGSAVLRPALEALGEVVVLPAAPGRPAIADDALVARLAGEAFDRVVFWQSEAVAARMVPLGLRGAVIVPGAEPRPDAFWGQFPACRFVTFDWATHGRLQALDCRTTLFEVWPEPAEAAPERDRRTAYFHERKPLDVPNLTTVAQQCEALGVTRLHVHAAPDRAGEAQGVYAGLGTLGAVALTVTTAEEAEAAAVAEAAATFVFAATLDAGIAGAHLAAMGRGQVVVGPDRAPLSEAVGHLSSGILYDPERPLELPQLAPARVAELGAAARLRAIEGRRQWEADAGRLASVLSGDGERWPSADPSAGFVREIDRAVRRRRLRLGERRS